MRGLCSSMLQVLQIQIASAHGKSAGGTMDSPMVGDAFCAMNWAVVQGTRGGALYPRRPRTGPSIGMLALAMCAREPDHKRSYCSSWRVCSKWLGGERRRPLALREVSARVLTI